MATPKTAARRKPALTGRSIARREILEAASGVVSREGPAALTMRRLAQELGASTMVVYARFKNRDELLEGIVLDAFTLFADALASVPGADPWAHLRLQGQAYRRFALEHPTYYSLMWGRSSGLSIPQVVGSPIAQVGQRAFGSLLNAVTRVLATMDRPAREAEPLAMFVWSTVHGFVSLELSGAMECGPAADASYERVLDSIVGAIRSPST